MSIEYEVRIYQYDGIKMDHKTNPIIEIVENFDSLDDAIKRLNFELPLIANRFISNESHYYIWVTKQYWIEDNDGNMDIEDERIIIRLSSDTSTLENNARLDAMMYNHVD